MSVWHWQRWIPAADLLDEWAWVPGELIHEVKDGRLTPVDRITLEPITFHENAKPEDIAGAVLNACFNAEAVQEYQRENNVYTKTSAKFMSSIMQSIRGLSDSQNAFQSPSSLLSFEEPDSPSAYAEMLRERETSPSDIIRALKKKWPHLKNYELGAYAKGIDPKDQNTRKAAEWHYRQHKPDNTK